MTANMPVLFTFAKKTSLFSVIGRPERGSSLTLKFPERLRANHLSAADFDTEPLP